MMDRPPVRWGLVVLLVALGASTPGLEAGSPPPPPPADAGPQLTRARPVADPPADRETWRLSGTLGLYAKYNSNLDLIDPQSSGRDRQGAFVGEPSVDLRLARSWGRNWWVDLGYAGHTNFHAANRDDDWYFNRGQISLGRALGRNSLYLSSEIRQFSEPRGDQVDFVRHTGLVTYRHVLSRLWQIRVGYENIATHYPGNRELDYGVNGGFVEVRNTWGPRFTTYYSYDRQSYEGTANLRENNPNASPEDGSRQTGRIGFDWLFSTRHTLSGTYTFQEDVSESGGQQIGGFEGHEGSQDYEAEFDLYKHKATLLYTWRASKTITVSAYEEWIRKNFDEEDDLEIAREERTDVLFLSSTYATVRLTDRLLLRVRYLFRMNKSSSAAQDYTDHILFAGPEYRF